MKSNKNKTSLPMIVLMCLVGGALLFSVIRLAQIQMSLSSMNAAVEQLDDASQAIDGLTNKLTEAD